MRGSQSDIKRSVVNQEVNRTTKTKASATKPSVSNICLTRNKNNRNPILFGSVKKQKNCSRVNPFCEKRQILYRSQKKEKACQKLDILQDLNTKISVDYMNTLYSDLGMQFGYRLRQKLQDKENCTSQRNINISLAINGQKDCLQKLKDLVDLKDLMNKAYRKMQNTRKLYFYIKQKGQTQEQNLQKAGQKVNFTSLNAKIIQFVAQFTKKDQQVKRLEHIYERSNISSNHVNNQDHKTKQDDLDRQIQVLKGQIATQKRLCLRYQNEQKFLMIKLYHTQQKNSDLRASSSNLKIKNINLRDTSKMSHRNQIPESSRLKRSLSMNLQRVLRFNFEEDLAISKGRKMQKSRSTSSLNSARILANLPIKK